MVDVVGNRLSGMKEGGSIVWGGGGCRGGGGRIIIGGRDLSTNEGTFDGVRARPTRSSIADVNVDSIESFLSAGWVLRGRGMNVGIESRRLGEGAATLGNEIVVGVVDGGPDTNWNCCDGGPTRNNVGDGTDAGVGGVDTGTGGGDHSSVWIDISLTSGLGGSGGGVSTTGSGSGVGSATGSVLMPTDSYVAGGGGGSIEDEGSGIEYVDDIADPPPPRAKRVALILSSSSPSLSEKSLSVTVRIEW